MTMTSSVPAVKTALLALLTDATGLEDVGVSYGNPYPDRESEEAIFIGSASERQLAFTAAMTQANETYSLAVLVSVIGSAMTPLEELEARAYAIVDLITDAVLAWGLESYGGVALVVLPGVSSDEEALDSGGENANAIREASVTLSLEVTARI